MSSPPPPPAPQPEPGQISIGSLHAAVLRETESDSLLELDPDFYRNLADFIGDLGGQEFDGVEGEIKEGAVGMATELTSLLVGIRMGKISGSADPGIGNLLDEEKFVLDSQEERRERREMIVSATIGGRREFLESLAQGHKTRRVVVRFLKDVDEIVGADLGRYGPFRTEDVATIPHENALALIAQDAAARVRWKD